MPTFKYRAKTKAGREIIGEVEAPSLHLAQETLSERGLSIVLLAPARAHFKIPGLRARIKARDLVIFFRQLSTLAGANVPLVQALNTLVEQTRNPELKRILGEVADEVEAGTRFSLALSKYPHVFHAFIINMARSGETAGRLADVLNYLADQTEKDYDLVSKVRSAMMYPAFIIAGMIIVGIVLLVFVIPQLTAVLIESGATLPITTRTLIGASAITKKFWWLILFFLIAAGVGFRFALRSGEFREKFDKLKLRLPILGSLYQRIAMARLTRSLQILLSGGVDMVGALEVVSAIVGNSYYAKIVRETRRQVADGSPLTSVFAAEPLIPAMVSQMLAVGEETGQLIPILEKITSFYTREVDNSVATLVSVIEPLLMVVIGIGVGLVVSSIILPMYQLAGQF
ncbi:type II secretion system F family protein [Candidatus Uhrbacteria bacterium]|nr:type II secretion system F family protein [Candidatus Uhrbacteria bacterium]